MNLNPATVTANEVFEFRGILVRAQPVLLKGTPVVHATGVWEKAMLDCAGIYHSALESMVRT